MTDLFSYDTYSAYQDERDESREYENALCSQMKAIYKQDQEIVRQRGIIPDWIGEPRPLSKDKARLLALLYDIGSIEWASSPCENNRKVTKAIGLNNTANAKAVIAQCHEEELIQSRIYRGKQVFELTKDGEYALDEYQLDVEMGIV